jgi:hypothetical protein
MTLAVNTLPTFKIQLTALNQTFTETLQPLSHECDREGQKSAAL